VSANEIEHGILRGNRPHPLATQTPFGADDPRHAWSIAPLDPRTHCAISCGARSCPPVRAYDARRVQTQLEAAADAFVSREVTLESGRLAVSELFRWFAGDFAAHPGGLAGFLLRHLTEGPVRLVLPGPTMHRPGPVALVRMSPVVRWHVSRSPPRDAPRNEVRPGAGPDAHKHHAPGRPGGVGGFRARPAPRP
jgi:hypothetical protein